MTPDGRTLFVVEEGDNTVSQYTIDRTSGVLSPKTPATVATGTSPYGVAVSPDGKSAYVTNNSDNTVSQYTIDPTTGALSPKTTATVATGAGPFGIAVTPDGKNLYVANATDNTVSQYTIDPTTGALTPKTPATVAAGLEPSIGVAVSADGKHVYVGNQGDNTVSQYTVDPTTGVLSAMDPAAVSLGTTPDGAFGIALTPDGKNGYVTNTSDGTVTQVSIDPTTGQLTTVGVEYSGAGMRGIAITPDGKSVYATDRYSGVVDEFTVDATTGALTWTAAASANGPFAIAVTPPVLVELLTVVKAGAGSGTVTSSPSGIDFDCGPLCTHQYVSGSSVTLTARPAFGSTFTGFSGEGCTGTGPCTVTVDQARSVTATFAVATAPLTVSKAGAGQGTVTSSPAGISCGTTCSSDLALGTTVTLTATPAAGSTFTGFTGAGCAGIGPCTTTVDQARSVTATFAVAAAPLSVMTAGAGQGTVTSSWGISCAATCSFDFVLGTTVTLTATPAAGSTFTGFTGAGCAGPGPCTVILDRARSVTATFAVAAVVVPPTTVTNYRVTNRVFTVAGPPTPLSGTATAHKRSQGTTFLYTLSAAATVKIAISQELSGRVRAGRCVAATKKLRHASKCTRMLARGTLTRSSHAGANKVAFSGRIGAKPLKPGTYQATIVATSHGSRPQTLTLRIVRP